MKIYNIYGTEIYSSEKETLKEAVIEAIESDADLRYANLSSADLRYANLSSADLSGTNLRYANLSDADLRYANLSSTNLFYANLSGANLSGTNLSSADLSGTNLSSANLSGANLSGTNLSNANLRYANLSNASVPMFCKWSNSIINGKIKIACKTKTIKEWNEFFKSEQVIETERNTEEFARVEAMFKANKAYLEHMNKFKTN